ncbi:MAG: GyrI-like domain-containing protein [Lachnospiraceae bacterium]|nr:GyrI-like domain-containing protein [Lachnospiraceae bacterium]
MAIPVRIRKIPACVCATMISRIESYDNLFEVMPQMGALMEEAVREHGEAVEGLTFKEFPETEVVSIYHKGSYADFSRTCETILKYIEENGYEICGNIRENYIDGAWNKDSETEWLSEIQIPVQKKQKAYSKICPFVLT